MQMKQRQKAEMEKGAECLLANKPQMTTAGNDLLSSARASRPPRRHGGSRCALLSCCLKELYLLRVMLGRSDHTLRCCTCCCSTGAWHLTREVYRPLAVPCHFDMPLAFLCRVYWVSSSCGCLASRVQASQSVTGCELLLIQIGWLSMVCMHVG